MKKEYASLSFLMLIFFLIVTNLPVSVYAESEHTDLGTTINPFESLNYTKQNFIRINMDGEDIDFDVKPQIMNGRTLVPMRFTFEKLGLEIEWNQETKTVIGKNEDKFVIITIGSRVAYVNDIEKILDVPAMVVDDRTLVPLRFLSESMGYNVVWIPDSDLILLSRSNIIEWRLEGYDIIAPHNEYERKYIDGSATNETRYTGNTRPVSIEWRLEGYTSIAPFKEFERKYTDGLATSEIRYTGIVSPVSVEWRLEGYTSIAPYREYERKYIDSSATNETRYTGNVSPISIEWRIEGYENIPPYNEYERKYIDGLATTEIRYTGNVKPMLIVWRNEGYENIPPYKEYERKYIDGLATTEISYTGNVKPISIVWQNEGYENTTPYKEYERKYIDGLASNEIRYTGQTKPIENPIKNVSYSWEYPYDWTTWSFSLNIPIKAIDIYRAVSRDYIFGYSYYVSHEADDEYMNSLAQMFVNTATREGFSEWDTISLAVSFVQSLEYVSDIIGTGFDEYPKFPLETLFDKGGDCEDSSILLASILRELGYGTVLVMTDDHMGVGLLTSDDGDFRYLGRDYHYIETTAQGWDIGELPEGLYGLQITILPVN